jgi:hypothetical protein
MTQDRDIADERIAETGRFISIIKENVPEEYRHQFETRQCFSPVRDYQAVSDVAYVELRDHNGNSTQVPCRSRTFAKKRDNLILADSRLVSQARDEKGRFKVGYGGLAHVLGNGKGPCERCLRIINAGALGMIHDLHPDMFTQAAHKLAWLEILQRRKEQAQESQGNAYSGDELLLLQAQTQQRGCTTIHDNRLAFYSEYSVNDGVRALVERVNQNLDLAREYPGLIDLARGFSESRPHKIPGMLHQFYVRTAYDHVMDGKVNMGTVIDIFSINR